MCSLWWYAMLVVFAVSVTHSAVVLCDIMLRINYSVMLNMIVMVHFAV